MYKEGPQSVRTWSCHRCRHLRRIKVIFGSANGAYYCEHPEVYGKEATLFLRRLVGDRPLTHKWCPVLRETHNENQGSQP
jgi:hypothetical protein